MATTEERAMCKQIRKIVMKSGYPHHESYNDKLVNGRKLKFVPGYENAHPTLQQQVRWENRVKRKLADAGIQVKSVAFEQCCRPYVGTYQALIVRT